MLNIMKYIVGSYALAFLVLWGYALVSKNHKPLSFFTLYAKRVMLVLAGLLILGAIVDKYLLKN